MKKEMLASVEANTDGTPTEAPVISIKKLLTEDWKDYRDIRLEALRANPEFFCPSRDETKFSEDDWRQRLSNENSCIFGLYDGPNLIGLTGISRDKSEFDKAHMVSSYIKSQYQKRGLSSLLYEARINWARAQKNIKCLLVDIVHDNEASKRANQKFGFEFFKEYQEAAPNGQTRKIWSYKLDI